MEEQIVLIIQKLMESGALDRMEQPGGQTLLIYSLLILLAMLSFRVFVINGWLKKGVVRFFDLEERKLASLEKLNEQVVVLQTQVREEHERLTDVMRLLQGRRHSDGIREIR